MDFAQEHQVITEVAAALRRHQAPVTPTSVGNIAMALNQQAPTPVTRKQALLDAVEVARQAVERATGRPFKPADQELSRAEQIKAELSRKGNENVAVVLFDDGEARAYLRPRPYTPPPAPLTAREKFEASRPFASPARRDETK
jgi:hypothetical protein